METIESVRDRDIYWVWMEYNGKHIPVKLIDFSITDEEEFTKHIEEIYKKKYLNTI